MSEATLVSLPEIAHLKMGETLIAADCTGDGVPIYSAETAKGAWNRSTHCRVRHRRGSLVVGARGSIGYPRLPNDEEFAATQTTIVITPDVASVAPQYLFYALSALDFTKVTAQQAVPMLTVRDLSKVTIPRPNLPTQRRIALVLRTVDEVIEWTEKRLEKQQAIKQGLLHDLFTRGLTPEGKLRPSPTDRPDLYQDSPLGPIPKEWEVEPLGNRAKFTGGCGFPETLQGQTEGELPFYKVSDMNLPGNRSQMRLANNYVSRQLAKQMAWRIIPSDSVVFAKVGAALLQNRRRVTTQDCLVDNNMMAALPLEGTSHTFLYWWLQTLDFSVFVQDGAVPSVNQSQLSGCAAAFPPESEQQLIVKTLEENEEELTSSQLNLTKLRHLKSALMQDLLTGRVSAAAIDLEGS